LFDFLHNDCYKKTQRCFNLTEDITKYSNEIYNKFKNIRQHNKHLLEHTGYMFRPVNRSLSGLQQNKSKVLLRNWDPNIFLPDFVFVYNCKKYWDPNLLTAPLTYSPEGLMMTC